MNKHANDNHAYRRLLNKKDAAAYCGVSVPIFDSAEPPAPVRLAGRVLRWDVRALDRWIDSLGGANVSVADDALEQFLVAR